MLQLDDSPDVFSGMAKLATCNAGTEIEVANTDRVVLELIREVVVSFGHGSDENCDALILVQSFDVVSHSNHLGVEAQCHLPAIGREVIGDWILNDLDELLLGGGRSDLMPMEQLDHQASESLEGTWDPDRGADLNEDIPRSVNVDLKLAGFIDR